MPEYTQEQIDDVCRKLLGDYGYGTRPGVDPSLVIQVLAHPERQRRRGLRAALAKAAWRLRCWWNDLMTR